MRDSYFAISDAPLPKRQSRISIAPSQRDRLNQPQYSSAARLNDSARPSLFIPEILS